MLSRNLCGTYIAVQAYKQLVTLYITTESLQMPDQTLKFPKMLMKTNKVYILITTLGVIGNSFTNNFGDFNGF